MRKELQKVDEAPTEDEEARAPRRLLQRESQISSLLTNARARARRPPPPRTHATRARACAQVLYKIEIPANRYDMLCIEARTA